MPSNTPETWYEAYTFKRSTAYNIKPVTVLSYTKATVLLQVIQDGKPFKTRRRDGLIGYFPTLTEAVNFLIAAMITNIEHEEERIRLSNYSIQQYEAAIEELKNKKDAV